MDLCNEARKELPLLHVPGDLMTKTRSFEKHFTCMVYDRTSARDYEKELESNVIKCYTDGSKMNDRIGASVYIEYSNHLTCQKSYLGKLRTVFQAEVFTIQVSSDTTPNTSHELAPFPSKFK